MPDIFDEVSEDLRAERMQRLLQRYGWLLAVAAVAIVAAVGGWQYWRWHQGQSRASAAATFMTAVQQSSTPLEAQNQAQTPARTAALQTFTNLAANGPSGYRTLARLREAALQSGNDLPAALALWDKVSSDEEADPQLRHLADLLWVQHQVDSGDPAAVEGRLAPLIANGSFWRPLALECQALLKLRTGDKTGAIAILRELVAQPTTPNGVRARANGLLVRLGAPPEAPADSSDKQG